ncbi:MAG TPA: methyltransferase domain-containing protein [Candidatus Dormibacteraeota bacterium]|nr:methyltransferase domain-containing protein [Candidatus Dormibacteraeota bacterium]
MDYAAAVAAAPLGWKHFRKADIDRLPRAVRRRALAQVPAGDVQLMQEGDPSAEERVLRATFWTLVYHLEPKRWDALADVEPIAPAIIATLPRAQRALDVGAGSGRLTHHLVARAEHVAAIEPSLGLLAMLRARLPRVLAIAAWAEALPIGDGWSQLTVAGSAFGPDAAVLGELERVTSPGGVVALINPEEPEWFAAHGWERRDVEPAAVRRHDEWIDQFFGPPDPPTVIVSRRLA